MVSGEDVDGDGFVRGGERPGVYARLAEQADVREVVHTPPRGVRWLGWALVAALVAVTVAAAVGANPW